MSRNLRKDCLACSSISLIFIGESMCVGYTGSVREYPVLGIHNGRLSGGMVGRFYGTGYTAFQGNMWSNFRYCINLDFRCCIIRDFRGIR